MLHLKFVFVALAALTALYGCQAGYLGSRGAIYTRRFLSPPSVVYTRRPIARYTAYAAAPVTVRAYAPPIVRYAAALDAPLAPRVYTRTKYVVPEPIGHAYNAYEDYEASFEAPLPVTKFEEAPWPAPAAW